MTLPIPRSNPIIDGTILILLIAWALALSGLAPMPLEAQASGARVTVSVTVTRDSDSVPLAGITVRGGDVSNRTDAHGLASLSLPPGNRWLVALRLGFAPESVLVSLRAGTDTSVSMRLVSTAAISSVVVSATRSERRIEDDPLRVEVLDQEEVDEKLRMTPGDITMMLNESSGLRVQTTSPSLGGANVRVQGLRGRYTQILSDGLPLYGGQTGGLGLLQIPPMDLGGVEIIKGAASALYGGSALGGVINLVSRRPGDEPVHDLLANQTTLGGTDLVGFLADRATDAWGYTVLAGAHRQSQVDRDSDGWTDLPGYERVVLRPRAFWEDPAGHSLMLTAGTTIERRDGGSMDGATAPDGTFYPERLRTARFDAGMVGRWVFGNSSLSARGSATDQDHRHTFGAVEERDRHLTWFGEVAMTHTRGTGAFVTGVALQQERYTNEDVRGFDFTFTTPGIFAQATLDPHPRLSLTTSARLDRHSEYGAHFSPRVSALVRVAPGWSVRTSLGGGYFAPTPFTEETEVTGLTPLVSFPLLRADQARGGSVDLGGTIGSVEVNATLFGSLIRDAVGVRSAPSDAAKLELLNVAGTTRTAGAELLARWALEPFHVTASYTHVRSTEIDPESARRRLVPLTPDQQAGLVGSWEKEDEARIGVEVYYTGRQSLDDNPYRTTSRPYVHIGALVERRFGRARVFVNAENLLGYRQTQYDRLVLPARGPGGRWTTDVWGPLEGRVANFGLRLDAR
jgi:iron complex outermembrane receptor protein